MLKLAGNATSTWLPVGVTFIPPPWVLDALIIIRVAGIALNINSTCQYSPNYNTKYNNKASAPGPVLTISAYLHKVNEISLIHFVQVISAIDCYMKSVGYLSVYDIP